MGTQIDLRDDAATIDKLAKNKQKPLSLEAGEKLAKELRAVKYVECSALTQVSVWLQEVVSYALAFYRSQNVLCQSKFYEPAQKFDCI